MSCGSSTTTCYNNGKFDKLTGIQNESIINHNAISISAILFNGMQPNNLKLDWICQSLLLSRFLNVYILNEINSQVFI